jgi:hypothetical protein
MKTSIVTITYDKDLEFLKYNLKSIQKFCKGYHDNVVIIDNHENDCVETQKYLDSVGQKYFVNKEAKQVKKGYVRQQYIKLLSDLYVPRDTDYICHIDADSLFKKEHTPNRFFRNNKPILIKNNYSKLVKAFTKRGENPDWILKWKETTSEILNFDVEHEFMFRMPLVYPKNLTKLVREYIEKINNSSLLSVLKDMSIMSEYNVLGAYAHQFTYQDFFWIDRWDDEKLISETNYNDIFGHYSSREFNQPERYVDLSQADNELSKIINEKI